MLSPLRIGVTATVCRFGKSLFSVYRERRNRSMKMTSFSEEGIDNRCPSTLTRNVLWLKGSVLSSVEYHRMPSLTRQLARFFAEDGSWKMRQDQDLIYSRHRGKMLDIPPV